jgi:hypothetical protein
VQTKYSFPKNIYLFQTDLNLAKAYDKNYPVIFNIFLFFGIGFVFALLAISSKYNYSNKTIIPYAVQSRFLVGGGT